MARNSGQDLDHVINEGESVDSVAYRYGHAGDTLWDHPKNRELRTLRGDHRVLAPGDVVHVPALVPATFDGAATARRHTYRRKGVPSLLRFRPLLFGQDFPGVPFQILRAGEVIHRGTTGANGDVEYEVVPDEPALTVRVDFGPFHRDYELTLRALDPITEVRGVQQRLSGLGYYDGPANGELDSATSAALARFCMRYGIYGEGGVTDEMRDALHRVFGG